MKIKVCSRCFKDKPLSEFYKNNRNKGGNSYYCKTCSITAAKEHHFFQSFGITLEEYDQMVQIQMGVCAICGEPEKKEMNGVVIRLSVDHDHKTEKVRGLLCSNCNPAIGYLKDSPVLCMAAAKYLLETE